VTRAFRQQIAIAGVMVMASVALDHAKAQTVAAPADQGAGSSSALEEIVVTAQKRPESLQDVPISVNAFNAQMLSQANITSVLDLRSFSPSLNVDDKGGIVTPFVRGVGNFNNVAGDEASVATYVDGVYISRLSESDLLFNDVERVEVLAGPQGTLFGRNASGGAINVITKDPTQDTVIHADAGFANYGVTTTDFYGATGITDKLTGSVAAIFQNQNHNQGWGRDLTTGAATGFDNYSGVRAKLLFEPFDETQIRLTYNNSQSRSDLGNDLTVAQGTQHGTLAPPSTELYPPSFYDTINDYNGYVTERDSGTSLRIDQQFSDFRLSSLTAYLQHTERSALDIDFTPQPYGVALLDAQNQQLSQELQIASLNGSTVKWIAGLYYLAESAAYPPAIEYGILAGGPGNSVQIFSEVRDQSYAGFGQVTFPVLPDTNLTVGLRYSSDHLQADGRLDLATPGPVVPLAPPVSASDDFSKVNYKVSLDHHFNPSVMAYILASTGYKAGTYDTLPIASTVVQPETLTNYEIGAKTELLDHRLRINGAIFHDNLKDVQESVIVTGLGALLNAPGAIIQGLEIAIDGQATDQLAVHVGYQYLHAYFSSFPNAPYTSQNPNPPYGNYPYTSWNATGFPLTNAPANTGNISLNYKLPSGAYGGADFYINYAYNSGFYFQPDPNYRQTAFGLLDANLRWILPNPRWTISLWGKNLTHTDYYLQVGEEGGPQGYTDAPGAPRTFGVRVTYDSK
jgi:iron complex outermembrane receptor protein